MAKKEDIKSTTLQFIQRKIDELEALIHDAQSSANLETKSTAGDKHETAKAQAQNEVERLSKQLVLLKQQRNTVEQLPTNISEKVQAGSFVQTSHGDFYVSVGLGKIEQEGWSFFALGVQSPLAQQMLGKRSGDRFLMNNGKNMELTSCE